jgi:hypothetical protein
MNELAIHSKVMHKKTGKVGTIINKMSIAEDRPEFGVFKSDEIRYIVCWDKEVCTINDIEPIL